MQATAEETMTEVEDTEAKIVAALETVFAADGEQWLSRPFFTGRVKEVLGALGHEEGDHGRRNPGSGAGRRRKGIQKNSVILIT